MDLKIRSLYANGIFKRPGVKDLVIFLIPFAVFGFFLYVYDPAIMRPDSFNQFHQIATGQFYSWHPFIHTFIEMMCLGIYPDPKSVAILQIVTFSSIWMLICNYFRGDDTKSFIIQAIFTLAIAVIPINAVFSITLLKDVLFSYILLLSCFLIKVLLDRKGEVNYLFIIVLCLAMAFVAQLRYNGMYIIAPTLVILAVYLFRTQRSKRLYVAIPALTVIFILLIASLNIAYDVTDNQKDALMAKTSHMLADYDLNLSLADSDREMIHEFLSENAIHENYNITNSDPIDKAANSVAFEKNKSEYLSMAVRYSLENPGHFLKYLFESTPMVWNIVRGDDWSDSSYATDTQAAMRHYYSESGNTPVKDFENVTVKNKGTELYQKVNSHVVHAKKNSLINTLFFSPALCMYLSFVLLAAICILTKSREILLVYLPNLINIAVIFVSAPVQDVRYLYPNMLMLYMLIIIMLNVIEKRKESSP